MKRKNWVVGIALVIFFASALVFAQARGSYSLGGFGGLCLPKGPDDFKDYFKSGTGFGVEFKTNINEQLSFVGSFASLPFKLNEDKVAEEMAEDIEYLVGEYVQVNVEGGLFRVNAIQADFLYSLSQPGASTGFYLIVGGGYYMPKFQYPDKIEFIYEEEIWDVTEYYEFEEESENDFGVNFGAGLELAMGTSAKLFIEAKYHIVSTEDESTKFITLMGGVRFPLQ